MPFPVGHLKSQQLRHDLNKRQTAKIVYSYKSDLIEGHYTMINPGSQFGQYHILVYTGY